MPEAAAVTHDPSWVGSVREYIFVLVFLLSHPPTHQQKLSLLRARHCTKYCTYMLTDPCYSTVKSDPYRPHLSKEATEAQRKWWIQTQDSIRTDSSTGPSLMRLSEIQ